MMSQITLIGRLTAAPNGDDTKFGKRLCKFSLATNEDKEKANYHNIVCYDKTAEVCEKYLTKGSMVYIFGRQINDTYEKDGEKKYYSKVNASKVLFLDGKGNVDTKKETIEDQMQQDEIPF